MTRSEWDFNRHTLIATVLFPLEPSFPSSSDSPESFSLPFSMASGSKGKSPALDNPQPQPDAPCTDVSDTLKYLLESIFDEEMAGLLDGSQRARYRALEAAGGALAKAQAILLAEREETKAALAAADHAAAEAASRVTDLKEKVNLQAAKMIELEGRLLDQIAKSEKLGAQAARVPQLETQIAEGYAQEAHKMEVARHRERLSFVNNELPARLAQATEVGSARGRFEGFSLGFYWALKKFCEGHPEMRAEAARLSVEEARAEADAEAAAALQAQLQTPPVKKARTLSEAGPSDRL